MKVTTETTISAKYLRGRTKSELVDMMLRIVDQYERNPTLTVDEVKQIINDLTVRLEQCKQHGGPLTNVLREIIISKMKKSIES